MKSLNEDIKTGQFKQAYLLYGEEAYLKKQYKDKLTKAMLPEGDTVNYAYYEGKGTNPAELIDLAETMPFFADRRLIVVENSGFFKNATPELADYIKNMPETACFLFVESEVDKRGKMYKSVKDKGRAVEMGRQDEKTLLYWLAGMVKKEGKQIKESTARYLVAKTGTDMENLEKEMGILGRMTAERDALEAQKQDMAEMAAGVQADIARREAEGTTIFMLKACFSILESARNQLEEMEEELRLLQAGLERQRQIVTEASREVKKLEKLKEKQLEEYHRGEAKEQQETIAEHVAGNFVRRGASQ